MSEKELLRKIGTETLYSAKGHFKSVDIRRMETKFTIVGCMMLSLAGVIGINQTADKWLSTIGLFFTFLLFYWDAEEGKDYRTHHKKVAELYLALHKEIRSCYFLTTCETDEVKKLSTKVMQLDQSTKPDIPWLARKWAQSAIEKYDETDNWFNKK